MLVLSGIAKSYGQQDLFTDVSLRFPERGVVGLVGPNGAGKTTLLKIIAGELSPDRGDVIIPKHERIGYLGQEVEAEVGGSVLDTVLAGYAETLAIEHRLEQLAAVAAAGGSAAAAAVQDMAAVQEAFERVDGYRLVERAKTIAAGLGFTQEAMHAPLAQLSGGWRMRAVLARMLLEAPAVLLLDEPTNHLDIDALLWLESFLSDHDRLIILTSHDRSFLDGIATHIAALEDGTLRLYPGNYADYEAARELRLLQQEAEAANVAAKRAQLERFIARFGAKATKARQAKSKQKQLDRLGEAHVDRRVRKRMQIKLRQPPRAPKTVAELRGVRKAFGANVVFDGIDWRLERGQKVAVVGPNGAGKTTLLRLLAGDLRPDAGELRLGPAVEAAYFAQHHLEALDPRKTVLQTLYDDHGDVDIPEVRGLLGAFLFSGNAVDKHVAVLSGGERARLSLARLFLRPRNLLLLDEPTNHLDIESREVLADALCAYSGTIVAVSHDRSFLDAFVDHVVDLHPGSFVTYPGNTEAYAWHQAQKQPLAITAEPVPTTSAAERTPRGPSEAATAGGDTWKRRKELRNAYKTITRKLEAADARVSELQRLLLDPANAADHDLLWRTQEDLHRARAEAETLMQEWEALVAAGAEVGLDLLEDT